MAYTFPRDYYERRSHGHLFKRIKMKGGPLLKALRKFKSYTPDLKDGEILVTCPACLEN